MAVLTDRPNATISAGVGFTVVGTASFHAALSDDSDASYVRTPSPVSQNETPEANRPRLGFPDTAVPAGATIDRVRLRMRVLDESADPWETALSAIIVLNDVYDTDWVTNNDAYVAATFVGPWRTAKPGGGVWTQADLNAMEVRLRCFSNFTPAQPARCIELWRDIEYTPGGGGGSPSLTVTAAVAPGSLRPDFEWEIFDPDTRPQEEWRAKAFSSAQYTAGGFNPATATPAWDSGDVASVTDRDATVGSDLVDGLTYRIYMLVALTDSPPEDVGWSASNEVTISGPEPPPPGEASGDVADNVMVFRDRLSDAEVEELLTSPSALGGLPAPEGRLVWHAPFDTDTPAPSAGAFTGGRRTASTPDLDGFVRWIGTLRNGAAAFEPFGVEEAASTHRDFAAGLATTGADDTAADQHNQFAGESDQILRVR